MRSLIQDVESENFCEALFSDFKLKKCEANPQKLYEHGLTSALYQVYNYVQQLVFKQDDGLFSKREAQAYVKDEQFNKYINQMHLYLYEGTSKIQRTGREKSERQFENLANIFDLIFGIYLCLAFLIVLFFYIFFFKRAKMDLQRSANMLVLLPMISLEMQDRAKVEAFIAS